MTQAMNAWMGTLPADPTAPFSPAMLLSPHTLPPTANGLLDIGRERRHPALVCAFIVEGIKFQASFCLAMI